MDHHPGNETGHVISVASPTPTEPVQKPNDSIDDSAQLEVKRIATLAARIALLGGELHELRSGGLLVRAGGASRHFNESREIKAFLAEVTAGTPSDKTAAKTTAKAANAKATTTLQAEFALRGWQLIPQPNGAFVARKWGRLKELGSLAESQRFYDQIVGIK